MCWVICHLFFWNHSCLSMVSHNNFYGVPHKYRIFCYLMIFFLFFLFISDKIGFFTAILQSKLSSHKFLVVSKKLCHFFMLKLIIQIYSLSLLYQHQLLFASVKDLTLQLHFSSSVQRNDNIDLKIHLWRLNEIMRV